MSGEGCLRFLVPRATHNACKCNMTLNLLRRGQRQKGKKIAALCMITACLDDEGEGARKKGPERDWLRRRAERESYAGIITELVAEDLPSF